MPDATPRQGKASRGAILLAFGCTYFIWGSTYLAIRYAVETLPPFLMVGSRCLVAGTVLFVWARIQDRPWPELRHWRAAALTGTLFFVGGQGLLAWVERFVESGLAALFLAMIPVWMILLQARRKRPGPRTTAGVVLGLGGVALLIVPAGGVAVDLLGGSLLLLSAFCWAVASLVSVSAPRPDSDVLTTALQLLAGGCAAVIAGAITGELAGLSVGALSTRSLLAFAYLTVFGSLVTFSAYRFLLSHREPAAAGSYAFVNPMVAVIVGWAVGGETLTATTIVAGTVIVAGVYLVVTAQQPK